MNVNAVWGLVLALAVAGCKDKPAPEAAAPAAAPAPTAAVAPAPAGKGNISGEVRLVGAPPVMEPIKRGSEPACRVPLYDESAMVQAGKIQNAVVRVKGAPNQAAPAKALEIDQKDCMYRPRVQAAVEGQELIIRNTDGALHNVHSYLGSRTLMNRAQPPGSPPLDGKLADGAGVVRFGCDVHPWMKGFVLVSNNGYFGVTGPQGKFEIKDVPAGTYTLETWHEKFGMKSQSVTVQPDQTATVDVEYSADDRG